jgi:hypothetical protein
MVIDQKPSAGKACYHAPIGGNVKPRVLTNRTLQEAALRAGLRMLKIDIEIGVEFYEQTTRYFRKKIPAHCYINNPTF